MPKLCLVPCFGDQILLQCLKVVGTLSRLGSYPVRAFPARSQFFLKCVLSANVSTSKNEVTDFKVAGDDFGIVARGNPSFDHGLGKSGLVLDFLCEVELPSPSLFGAIG